MYRLLYLLFISFLLSVNLDYGFTILNDNSVGFKIYAPKSLMVELIIFDKHDSVDGKSYLMKKDNDDYFLIIDDDLIGKYYGYRLINETATSHQFDVNTIIADPFSIAVATQNHYKPVNKSIILKDDFDWGGDNGVNIKKEDLIIYELHLRDMTAHPSSQCKNPGTYKGFVDLEQIGGISHIKDMGYNAVQFLPLFEFANFEIPFLDTNQVITNTWNPYSYNHWGYMPSFFFAPEGYYSSNGSNIPNQWNGIQGEQINELKNMIKELHDNDIAVIMDVVYNHVSQYDNNPLKQINRDGFFRIDDEDNYINQSGCGNDIKSENQFIRNMIIQSVEYWIKEYHIDGFRFDLGLLLDEKTLRDIEEKVRDINPNIFLTAEPWGGGYDPYLFSDMNWSAWNDQFRNAFKGWNDPYNDNGFIFGNWHHDFNKNKIKRVFMGSPQEFGGQFKYSWQSLNYLESHDDYTLGDFIRLSLKKVDKNGIINNYFNNILLSEKELKIHKLAALVLFVSQGPVMIGEGQEWGRSKFIFSSNFPDKNIGKLDHNSYEKDNFTNWLDWNQKELNKDLVDYYRGLIKLRKKYDVLRYSNPNDFIFIDSNNDFGLGFSLEKNDQKMIVLLNGDSKNSCSFNVDNGIYKVLVNDIEVMKDDNYFKIDSNIITIPSSSGLILLK